MMFSLFDLNLIFAIILSANNILDQWYLSKVNDSERFMNDKWCDGYACMCSAAFMAKVKDKAETVTQKIQVKAEDVGIKPISPRTARRTMTSSTSSDKRFDGQ